MKRQKIILIAVAVVMGLICLAAGWFLFSAMSASREAAEKRDAAYDELQGIYRAKIYPSTNNIGRIKADQAMIEEWLVAASNLVHKGDVPVEEQSPAGFKQSLQAKVRTLSAQPGSVKGKVVDSAFKFGFDKYLGEDKLPEKQHVLRLTQQLAIIEQICKKLYEANILSLDKIGRETFDEETSEQPQDDPSPKRASKRKQGQPSRGVQQASAPTASEYFSKQRFTFEFTARPAACIDALNGLASTDLFMVVAETEIHKVGDTMEQRRARTKKDSKGGAEGATAPDGTAAVVDLSTVPHMERIVTDPELETPLSVRLNIDVYSFEGV